MANFSGKWESDKYTDTHCADHQRVMIEFNRSWAEHLYRRRSFILADPSPCACSHSIRCLLTIRFVWDWFYRRPNVALLFYAKCNKLEKHCLVIIGKLLMWVYATARLHAHRRNVMYVWRRRQAAMRSELTTNPWRQRKQKGCRSCALANSNNNRYL